MKRRLQNALAMITLPLLLSSAACSAEKTAEQPVQDADASVLVRKMGCGWNLGNTLDANPLISNAYGDRSVCTVDTETSWGMPLTTEDMIRTMAASGIKTIRIPVSWMDHIVSPDKDYTIDPAWLNRIKQITGWAVKYGMYAIINIHHDTYPAASGLKVGYGYYPSYTYEAVSLAYVENIWSQVADTFKAYDQHVIFETLNEPRLRGDAHEWTYNSGCATCRTAMKEIMKMNQKAVDTIRASGGNNTIRLIMVPSYCASPDAALSSDFSMPSDSSGMLALSVHMYSPYAFAMLDNAKGGTSAFTEAHKSELLSTFNRLQSKFSDNGYPVIIGEYGATNKNNLSDRAAWFSFFVKESTSRGMVPVLWDNNAPTNSDPQEAFGFFDRKNLTWYFPKILKAIIDSKAE